MKEFKIIYNVKEWDLNQLSKEGWTIVNIFPSEFEEYEFNRYKSIELTVVLCREKIEQKPLENKHKSWLQSEIESKVIEILAEHFETEKSLIKDDSLLVDELYMDSLDRVEIILSLERDFNIKISDEDAEKLFTVKDIINYILKRYEK